MESILTAVGTAVTSVIGFMGQVVTALTSAEGDLNGLLPLFGLGIAVSLVYGAVKLIRKFTWGA